MKSVRFHDSKLKLVKTLQFRSFHETEAPTAGFCHAFICGRAYPSMDNDRQHYIFMYVYIHCFN